MESVAEIRRAEEESREQSREEGRKQNTAKTEKKNKQVKITVVRARFLKRKIHTLTNKT